MKSDFQKKFLDIDQKSIASLLSKEFLNEDVTPELNKIVEMENKLNRSNLINKTENKKKDKIFDLKMFKTIRSFWKKIYNNGFSIDYILK